VFLVWKTATKWLKNGKIRRVELCFKGYSKDMNEKREVQEAEATPPAQPKAVLVQTEGFQCMAYQDCHGKWRGFYDLKLLPGKVEVVTPD
jgi:hypothetical protein